MSADVSGPDGPGADLSAAAARSRILDDVAGSIRRGVVPGPADAFASSLHTCTDLGAFAECELVVEAVPEDPVLKAETLARVQRVLRPGAVLASNTSSISIDQLARAVPAAADFVGMHFFNPVPASQLVEVVRGSATAGETVERVVAWVRGIGKEPIEVRDAPGFASSRLGVALGLEAIRMVEEGVASPADIDAAMELGYRHPVGPLRTTDLVGLDVRLGIAEELHAKLGERFAPPELLRRMVGEGRLGRKSGVGFYEWGQE